jgi:hypothetical protein
MLIILSSPKSELGTPSELSDSLMVTVPHQQHVDISKFPEFCSYQFPLNDIGNKMRQHRVLLEKIQNINNKFSPLKGSETNQTEVAQALWIRIL